MSGALFFFADYIYQDNIHIAAISYIGLSIGCRKKRNDV